MTKTNLFLERPMVDEYIVKNSSGYAFCDYLTFL